MLLDTMRLKQSQTSTSEMVAVAAIAEIHWIDSQTKSWIWRPVTPLIITHKMMYVGQSLLNIKETDERTHQTFHTTAKMVRLCLYIEYIRILGNRFKLVLMLFYHVRF